TQLMMMKADVLSGIDTIKACTHYELNGEKIDYLPFEDNENLIPVYNELQGWEMDLMQLENLSQAPKTVHDYITWLEDVLETPISIVSVGPDRKQTLYR
ncbi:MAG: adenylosuccinate synthetase, partial [Cryomorphaceae bacterium]|nr:adenylosuccinate synthetase [Cryomorphaceae bacterium]